MKRSTSLTPRQLLLCSTLLFLFALMICLPFFLRRDEIRFRRLSETLYRREMSANTISLHYSLAHPETYGIMDPPVTLPIYSPGSEEAAPAYLEGLLEEVNSICRANLSKEDAYACDCLADSLKLSLSLSAYPYYAEPLSPVQGVQSQLPILLSEYEFREKKDVDEYLALLGQTCTYFDSLLLYETEKGKRGLLMSTASLRETEKQCDAVLTLEALDGGAHFLQTSFAERLQKLSCSRPLSEEEMTAYSKQNEALLRGVLLPAYQALKKGLMRLESKAPSETTGLSCLPGGREYYRLLLERETGSSKTPEELRTLLEQTLIRESEAIRQITETYPGCLPSFREGTYLDLGMQDGALILEDLQKRMAGIYPSLTSQVNVELKSVDPSLQDASAPAFYLTAPIDETEDNTIYINPKGGMDSLSLYTTLAHEGYPGHLYQNAYMSEVFSRLKDSRIRQLIGTSGYLEGWALYVEQRSFDDCSRLLAGQGRAADAVCVQLEKHSHSLELCLYSLLDIQIHYEGISREKVTAYLSSFGIKNPDTAERLYDYICRCPCNYPKYYVGYLEILELAEACRETWGEQYSDLAFHTFLLEWGPADFHNLRKKIKYK